jgi:hypothetical protein
VTRSKPRGRHVLVLALPGAGLSDVTAKLRNVVPPERLLELSAFGYLNNGKWIEPTDIMDRVFKSDHEQVIVGWSSYWKFWTRRDFRMALVALPTTDVFQKMLASKLYNGYDFETVSNAYVSMATFDFGQTDFLRYYFDNFQNMSNWVCKSTKWMGRKYGFIKP